MAERSATASSAHFSPPLGEDGWMQATREFADLVQARRTLVNGEVEQLCMFLGRFSEPSQAEQHCRESLLGAVVQVALNPTALRVGPLDETRTGGAELGLRPPPVGDVSQVAGERRRAGQRDPGDRELDGGGASPASSRPSKQ